MIARLALRHEIVHNLTKPLLITVATVTLVLNILVFQMVRAGSDSLVDGSRAIGAQFAFLVPLVMILLIGKASSRCRPWEAGLPVAARSLWWAHLGALALSSLFLILVTGISFVGFGSLMGIFSGDFVVKVGDLVRLVGRPAVSSLTAACLVAAWRPGLGRLSDAAGWSRYQYIVILVAGGLLGLMIFLPPYFAAVPVTVALFLVRRTVSNLPASLEMGADGATGDAGSEVVWPPVEPSGRVVRLMILRTLFKWPVSWLAFAPFAALFGVMMSGANVMGMDEPHLRFTNFFMVVYILFAMSNHFMENLYKVDHLPIDRRVLLRWMVIPVAVFFMAGYAGGRVVESANEDQAEKIIFENSDDNYGLKVPPDVWELSTSTEPKIINSPWGEAHASATVPVLKGLPLVLWKTFTTPAGASRDFVSWQISRAAAVVYGLDIEPKEIAQRYLVTDPGGRVTVRQQGLTIAADYPGGRSSDGGPVFPILVGAEIIVLMIVNALFFRAFKPGITIKKSRIVFWVLMGGLMALHIGGYVLFIKALTREWIIYGFWMGRIRELGDLGPWGYGIAWVGAALFLWLAWRWAEKSFLEVEAPSS